MTTTAMTTTAMTTTTSTVSTSATPARPRLWLRLSITRGNLLQVVGTTVGATLIALAGNLSGPPAARFALALLGWLAIYDCTHSIGHYLVGRAVGIRFRFYGIRGSDHPEDYPPGLRQLMSLAPFWSVITDRASMRTAAPWRKALMFAAGETSTTICSTAAAFAAAAAQIPGAHTLLLFTIVWNAAATVVTAVKPKGDYAKARRAVRNGR